MALNVCSFAHALTHLFVMPLLDSASVRAGGLVAIVIRVGSLLYHNYHHYLLTIYILTRVCIWGDIQCKEKLDGRRQSVICCQLYLNIWEFIVVRFCVGK